MKLQPMLRELWRSGPGKAGMIMLGVLVVASLIVIATFPANFGTARWSNPSLWADNPKSAPPAWTNFFRRHKRPTQMVFDKKTPTSVQTSSNSVNNVYDFSFNFHAADPPPFLSFSISDVTYHLRPPIFSAVLTRPDGGQIVLDRQVMSAPRRGESAPYKRYVDEPLRIVVGGDQAMADGLTSFYKSQFGMDISGEDFKEKATELLFGKPGADGSISVLKGDYRIEIGILANSKKDTIGLVRAVVGGSVFGVVGTDALGRDLAQGLLYGLPVALLIGISTATVSTLVGMTLGMFSGYLGGTIDIVIQRAADIVANVPVLPLLIFLVFIGGSKLWLILLVLVAFSWPGLTIMVRTMVLQLSAGQEVESTRALGASSTRIIFRHILPHAASYVLAQLVFFAPSAILAEAGLSFLGLGDPSIPTWGQILEYGFKTGAVFLGYWWWVIPPGLLIVITAVTFMFLALGLEPVVDPRLRGRRSWHF